MKRSWKQKQRNPAERTDENIFSFFKSESKAHAQCTSIHSFVYLLKFTSCRFQTICLSVRNSSSSARGWNSLHYANDHVDDDCYYYYLISEKSDECTCAHVHFSHNCRLSVCMFVRIEMVQSNLQLILCIVEKFSIYFLLFLSILSLSFLAHWLPQFKKK